MGISSLLFAFSIFLEAGLQCSIADIVKEGGWEELSFLSREGRKKAGPERVACLLSL